MTKNKIFNIRIKSFFLFLLLSCSTYFIITYIFNNAKNSYLEQSNTAYQRAYNTIYNQYDELSDVIFSGLIKLINLENILENLDKKTLTSQNEIRNLLYKKTLQRFNILKSKKLIDISFILPNNKLFLSMEHPSKFNQKIQQDFKTVFHAQKYKKAIAGYEIASTNSGYRFAYPIIKNGSYLGTVLITFSEQAITSSFMKQYYVLGNFIIKASNFDKTFLKNTKKYTSANIDGFVHRFSILRELKSISRKDISKIKPPKHISYEIYTDAMKGLAHSIYIKNKDVIVTTIPVFNTISKEQLGFIAVLSVGTEINNLNKSYITILILFVILYGAICFLIYLQYLKTLTEKENLSEKLKKDAQLLEQAKLAQMGEMIGNIAHQWRQPLSTISTAASGLKMKDEFDLLSKEDISEYSDIILKNTNYLSETIDTFRDFIKEDREKKKVLLQERIKEMTKIVDASLKNSYIELICDINEKDPIEIETIAEELSQVLINLINNAKDAILQNDIENGEIIVRLYKKDDHAYITIEDNAKGIKEEILPKIFDPYFTTKHKAQGTGLGLYMSKIIIEKHLKGKLYAKNKHEGVRFTIELPLNY